MFGKKLPAAVLWDMDGTLVDSEEYWLSSEQALAKEHAGTWTETDGHGVIGLNLYESTKILKSKAGIDLAPEQIIDKLTDSVTEKLGNAIPWRPGAQELLRELRAKGIKTALVTGSMRRMATMVADRIPFKAFDVVVAGDDVVNGKPHPEPYLRACELLGVLPQNCVAFEDSMTGLLSAESAGTKAVGITNIAPLQPSPGRVIWPTLAGVQVKDLKKLFN